MGKHSEQSSYREKLLEHLFVGELLRHLWQQGKTAECLKPEVDNGGYDIAIECESQVRHIQLKSSYFGAKTARQNVHLHLANKPAGCVVWIVFEEKDLAIREFLFFGNPPGQRLQLDGFRTAKHTKGNAQGLKKKRPNLKVVPKRRFERVISVEELTTRLFGSTSQRVAGLHRGAIQTSPDFDVPLPEEFWLGTP